MYIDTYIDMWPKASFMISLTWQIQHKQNATSNERSWYVNRKRRPKSTNKNENWEAIKYKRSHSHPQANIEIKVAQEKCVKSDNEENIKWQQKQNLIHTHRKYLPRFTLMRSLCTSGKYKWVGVRQLRNVKMKRFKTH